MPCCAWWPWLLTANRHLHLKFTDQLRDFAQWLFTPRTSLVDPVAGSFVDLDQLQVRSDRRLVSAVLVFILVPLLWSVGLEFSAYAAGAPRLQARLILRTLSTLIPVAGLLALRMAHNRRTYSRVVLAISFLMVFNLTNLFLRPQGSELPMRASLMLLIVMYGALPNSFGRQVAPPLIYTTGVIAARTFWLTSDIAGDLPSDILILLFVNAIGVVMVHRRVALERETEIRFRAEQKSVLAARQALADLRTLRGIVPICSHCKKVRTEVGSWLQLEQYVAEHTDADFSHGICPSCLIVHYPRRKPTAG